MAKPKTIFCPHCGEQINLEQPEQKREPPRQDTAGQGSDRTGGSWPVFGADPDPEPANEDESFVWLRKPEREAVQAANKRKEELLSETAKREPKMTDSSKEGVSVLDVLDTDPTLNPGQRETVRMIYQRFAPKVKPAPSEATKALTVMDVLDTDPNLNKGQAETIRTIFAKFVPKR